MSMMNAAIGLDTALFGGTLIKEAAQRLGEDTLRSTLREENTERDARVMGVMKMQRLDAARRANIERLIRLRPDVYNMVAMGRKVPKGGTVIGRIDEDALDRLAIQMAEGTVGR
jgi:hypothetical protein